MVQVIEHLSGKPETMHSNQVPYIYTVTLCRDALMFSQSSCTGVLTVGTTYTQLLRMALDQTAFLDGDFSDKTF
jgi:hypothetical protein